MQPQTTISLVVLTVIVVLIIYYFATKKKDKDEDEEDVPYPMPGDDHDDPYPMPEDEMPGDEDPEMPEDDPETHTDYLFNLKTDVPVQVPTDDAVIVDIHDGYGGERITYFNLEVVPSDDCDITVLLGLRRANSENKVDTILWSREVRKGSNTRAIFDYQLLNLYDVEEGDDIVLLLMNNPDCEGSVVQSIDAYFYQDDPKVVKLMTPWDQVFSHDEDTPVLSTDMFPTGSYTFNESHTFTFSGLHLNYKSSGCDGGEHSNLELVLVRSNGTVEVLRKQMYAKNDKDWYPMSDFGIHDEIVVYPGDKLTMLSHDTTECEQVQLKNVGGRLGLEL